ncbi:hypothetical protein LTR36_006193 [Oleoguttula mirabilis]|uniref:non-specific serine/threonine protein kinase n=1 Tax=Oleoguttula mirabilis TaxID=1507867 RepID=A0AAV9JEG7_9PEZI|nr:hypothetical protein LTR36_006193 [Oleoguttula mirabilis]
MSSAAVQHSTPQQYDQGAQGRDRYAENPAANLSSSPPSSRRPGRQSSGGNASLPNTPQQPQLGSPVGSASMSTPRGPAGRLSPADPMASSTYNQFYPDPASSGVPNTALPIRTSSQQPSQSGTSASYDNSRYGSRGQAQSSGYGSESDRTGASDSDRRRQQHSPRADASQPGSGRSQRTRQAPAASRSSNAVGQTPIDSSLPRENSTVINRIVVDDPQSDLARESARVAEARPHQAGEAIPAMSGFSMPGEQSASDAERTAPQQRSRQEHLRQSSHRKEVKFGDYILGQTLGEGEFGKVKMGWKKDSTVQVAIKLIRKESLAGNATRLPKIHREIAILRELQHPNIVRLHEFVETERHMGIILEYASGGELFDYILNHRYLKDPSARRLFAQLVSGVGYLHRKGIVHRDLKLENLLLDRNKNIIITDFGFANTFNAGDELGEETERRITDKEFVKREGLDVVGSDNHRRGDLMQTSCGSPCYAAPELVVSDGLYTGRKVDVWSCGVILYAMLAGYLPFDDDPANPEGDNINLLYKYIVSTPLTFPEYVTPHARDLLRRILVPDPRRRADLFEVARHSWLSEYTHVVGFIGSSTKSERDIASSALHQEDEPGMLGRSASVREPSSRSPATMATSEMQRQPVPASDTEAEARSKQRDAKRRTVQVEYVAPQGATARGEAPAAAQAAAIAGTGRTRARGDSQGPVEVTPNSAMSRKEVPSHAMAPPTRPARDQIKAVSDSTAFAGQPTTSASRPTTGGTLGGGARLPSRGNSYSQPVAATPTTTNAQGHFSQPKGSTGYIISSPIPSDHGADSSGPGSQQNLAQFQTQQQQQQFPQRGHKRSSTLGSIGDRLLGRSNSRRSSKGTEAAAAPVQNEKRDRRYPPVSMKNALPNDNGEATPRPSTESRRRPSFNFIRKNSDAPSERTQRSSRRFSFLPNSFSMNSFGGGKKDPVYDSDVQADGRRDSMQRAGRPQSKGMAFGRGQSRSPSQSTTNSTIPLYYDSEREAGRTQRKSGVPQQQPGKVDSRYADKALPPQPPAAREPQLQQTETPPPMQRKQFRDDGYGGNVLPASPGPQEPVERFYTPTESVDRRAQQPRLDQSNPGGARQQGQAGYQQPDFMNDGYNQTSPLDSGNGQPPNIRPQQRKFENAYDQGHGGSSSGARRVMDFFRRRGKDRSQV